MKTTLLAYSSQAPQNGLEQTIIIAFRIFQYGCGVVIIGGAILLFIGFVTGSLGDDSSEPSRPQLRQPCGSCGGSGMTTKYFYRGDFQKSWEENCWRCGGTGYR